MKFNEYKILKIHLSSVKKALKYSLNILNHYLNTIYFHYLTNSNYHVILLDLLRNAKKLPKGAF